MKFVSSLRYEKHCRLQVVSLKRRGDMITNPASYSRGLWLECQPAATSLD